MSRWKVFRTNPLTGAVLGLVLTGVISASFTHCLNREQPNWEFIRSQEWCWTLMPWEGTERSRSWALSAGPRARAAFSMARRPNSTTGQSATSGE